MKRHILPLRMTCIFTFTLKLSADTSLNTGTKALLWDATVTWRRRHGLKGILYCENPKRKCYSTDVLCFLSSAGSFSSLLELKFRSNMSGQAVPVDLSGHMLDLEEDEDLEVFTKVKIKITAGSMSTGHVARLQTSNLRTSLSDSSGRFV